MGQHRQGRGSLRRNAEIHPPGLPLHRQALDVQQNLLQKDQSDQQQEPQEGAG